MEVQFGSEVTCLAGKHTLRIYPGEEMYDDIAARGWLVYCRPCQQKQRCKECDNDDCLICDACPPDMVFKTIMCVNCLDEDKDYDPEHWYCENCLAAQEKQRISKQRSQARRERNIGKLYLEKARLEQALKEQQQVFPTLNACMNNYNWDRALHYAEFLLKWAVDKRDDTRPQQIASLQEQLDKACQKAFKKE